MDYVFRGQGQLPDGQTRRLAFRIPVAAVRGLQEAAISCRSMHGNWRQDSAHS